MEPPRTCELLGYPADARLLIFNADDFGMYHAVTAGIVQTITDGVTCSTTLMPPCPWAMHAMRLLRQHPEIPCGVHLTIVTDFDDYRWGPLSPPSRVPSLLDATGFFHQNEPHQAFLAGLVLDEVALEFRAQIETVLNAGLMPTHLDFHCLRDGGRPDIFRMTLDLAREYGLAMRVFDRNDDLQRRGFPTNDHVVVDSTRLATHGKTATMHQMLRDLPAGLTEWAVHPALDTVEARAIDLGLDRRVADFGFLTSSETRRVIDDEGITLLDYRPLQTAWRQAFAATRER